MYCTVQYILSVSDTVSNHYVSRSHSTPTVSPCILRAEHLACKIKENGLDGRKGLGEAEGTKQWTRCDRAFSKWWNIRRLQSPVLTGPIEPGMRLRLKALRCAETTYSRSRPHMQLSSSPAQAFSSVHSTLDSPVV
jgi:hypothetical protein